MDADSHQAVSITPEFSIPLSELRFAASRASGPGGQHVNKTDTRIELRWNLLGSPSLNEEQRARLAARFAKRLNREGELVVVCAAERSQHRNRQIAIERFAGLLRTALTPRKRRVETAPTAASRTRRLSAKRKRADTKRSRTAPEDED
jgi:ribosome-associated protein